MLEPLFKISNTDMSSVVSIVGGVITEAVAATVFVLYGKTLSQFDKIMEMLAETRKSSFETAFNRPPAMRNKSKLKTKVERME